MKSKTAKPKLMLPKSISCPIAIRVIMRKHTVAQSDDGWTHEEIIEDGKFEGSGFGIGANESEVGIGYKKQWFWGTRTYKSHSRVLSKKESIMAAAVFGLLSILISTLLMLYGKPIN